VPIQTVIVVTAGDVGTQNALTQSNRFSLRGLRPLRSIVDAGSVAVNPNWPRVSRALAEHGVSIRASTLAAAEPRAKKRLGTGAAIQATPEPHAGGRPSIPPTQESQK